MQKTNHKKTDMAMRETSIRNDGLAVYYQNNSWRKSPPYSTPLRDALGIPGDWHRYAGTSADGSSVSIFIIVGPQSWMKAKAIARSHLFLLMPPGKSPFNYNWEILQGHDPIIAIIAGESPGNNFFTALATALVRDGVQRFLRPGKNGRAIRHLSREVVKCVAE